MLLAVILTFLNLFVPVFSGVLLLRVILSYILSPGNRLMEWLTGITEPVLRPIRRVIPAAGGIDFAPLAALLLLQGLLSFIDSFFPG